MIHYKQCAITAQSELLTAALDLCLDMIGMRTKAPKSNEGKMANGRETLRLRSKGAATVQEVVRFSGVI